MARLKATIQQPALRARRSINIVLASVGSGLPIRAKFDRLVRLRAVQVGTITLKATIGQPVLSSELSLPIAKAKNNRILNSFARLDQTTKIRAEYGISFTQPWILFNGKWNDAGFWKDTEKWKDN